MLKASAKDKPYLAEFFIWNQFQLNMLSNRNFAFICKSISFSFKTLCPHYVIVKVIFKSDVHHIKYYILKVNNDKLQCIPCFLFDCKFQHALTKINSNPLKKKIGNPMFYYAFHCKIESLEILYGNYNLLIDF